MWKINKLIFVLLAVMLLVPAVLAILDPGGGGGGRTTTVPATVTITTTTEPVVTTTTTTSSTTTTSTTLTTLAIPEISATETQITNWYAWYITGRYNPDYDPTHGALYMCNSTDGISYGNCRMLKGCDAIPGYNCGYNFFSTRPFVLKIGPDYQMWNSIYLTDVWGGHIYYMQTTNPLDWNVALQDVTGPVNWEEGRSEESVVYDGTKYIMWYLRASRAEPVQPNQYFFRFVRRTSNDGISWSSEQVIYTYGATFYPPRSHFVVPTNTTAKYLLFYVNTTSNKVVYRKSLDSEGISWSEPTVIDVPTPWLFTIQLDGTKTYLYCGNYNNVQRVEFVINSTGDVSSIGVNESITGFVDPSGLGGTGPPFFLHKEDLNPIPNITHPVNGSMITGLKTIISEDLSGENDIVSALFEYSPDGIDWFGIGEDTNGSDGWDVSWDTSWPFDGNYFIRVTMTDIVNNTGNDTIIVYVNNQVPEPYITEPSNDGFLYNNITLGAVIYGNITEIVAVEMNLAEDVVSTLFEYSSDGLNWTTIGLDMNESYDCVGINCVGRGGWNIEWNVSGLTEGMYYIKTTMTDLSGQSGDYHEQVYLDPTPPIPEIYKPSSRETINGTMEFRMNTSDEDVVHIQLGYYPIEISFNGSDVWEDQKGLGEESQWKVGPGVDLGGGKFANNYCGPTSVKNALWRLARVDKRLLKIPKNEEKKYMECFKKHMETYNKFIDDYPDFAEQKNLKKHKLEDYNTTEDLTDLGFAVILACKMGTTKNGGTTNLEKGIDEYLKEVGLEKEYVINPSVTHELEGKEWKMEYYFGWWWNVYEDKNGDGKFTPDELTDKIIGPGEGYYENEIQKKEAVVINTVKVNPGPDGKYGTIDDVEIKDTEHYYAGVGYLFDTGPGKETKGWFLVEPGDGQTVIAKYVRVKGQDGTVNKEFVELNFSDGTVRKVLTVTTVSETKKEPNIIKKRGGSSDWSIYWNTTNVSDGYYLIEAMLIDASGNIGKDYIMVMVDNNPPTMSIISPQNTTYSTNSIPLTFTINEPASWCSYSLDGNANITLPGCANKILTGLTNGQHNIIVYANDTVGNMGSSSKVYFTVTIPTTTIGYGCKFEGGTCMSGSMGCIRACQRKGQHGYCELGDPLLGYYPGCRPGNCCCFCV